MRKGQLESWTRLLSVSREK